MFIANCTYVASQGVMFDYLSDDLNYVAREGAMVFYKWNYDEINCNGTNLNDVNKITMSVYIHELSHCFNLQHAWSGPTSILSYATTANHGVRPCVFVVWNRDMHYYGYNDPPETNREFQFYQYAPESWIKPGRYGTSWTGTKTMTSPPIYNRYGQ